MKRCLCCRKWLKHSWLHPTITLSDDSEAPVCSHKCLRVVQKEQEQNEFPRTVDQFWEQVENMLVEV